MAYDINQVFLIGRLTRDPETRQAENTTLCRFSIANNERNDKVSYFDIVTFGKVAEICQQYLSRGKQVAVMGRLSQNRWEKDGQTRSKVEVIGTNIQFLGSRSDGEMSSGGYQKPGGYRSAGTKPTSGGGFSGEKFNENEITYDEEVSEPNDYETLEQGNEDIPF